MRDKQEVNTMNSETLTSAVLRKWNEDAHGGHAEEHRQEMIAIAKEVIKQYANTELRQTIRQMVDEAIAQKLRDFEAAQININYDFKSTIAKQTEKIIKEVFEKEMDRMFKKHGMKVTWK